MREDILHIALSHPWVYNLQKIDFKNNELREGITDTEVIAP